MSLTSELAIPSSPITQYLKFVGTLFVDADRGAPWAEQRNRLLGLDALPPTIVVPPLPGSDAGMVGTAFDYRLRYHFATCQAKEFVAWKGASLLTKLDPTTDHAVLRFFSNLNTLSSQLSPAGRVLSDEDEALLSTYCIVLAQFESVFRTRGKWTPDLPSTTKVKADPYAEPLLRLAPDAVVKDVVNLSRSAEEVMSPLIPYVASESLSYSSNPTFEGSGAIGGADADFIIAGTVFELKTTKTLDASALRSAFLQLLGYGLLDYDDEFEIRRVGVYFARHAWVTAWPLWQLIFPPNDVIQRTHAGTEPTEAEVTVRLEKLRGLMQRVVDGEAINYDQSFS